MNIIVRIMQLYVPFRRQLFVSFALLMAVELLGIVSPYLYGQMINVADSRQLNLIVWVAIAYVLALAVSRLVNWVRDKLTFAFDQQAGLHVSMYTMQHVLAFSIGQHHNENSGIKQQVINRGENAIQQGTSRMLFDLLPMVIGGTVSMVTLLFYNTKIGLITLGGITVYILLTTHAFKKFVVLIRDVREKNREAGKVYGETMRNVELVKLNAREEKAQADYREALVSANALERATWLRVMNYWFTSGIVLMLVTTTNLLMCALMVYHGDITVGAMVTCIGWSGPILMRVQNAGSIQRTLMDWRVDIDRYFKMMDVPCDINVLEHPVRPHGYRGEITFENVSFAYPRRQWLDDEGGRSQSDSAESPKNAIENFSLTLRAGRRYAIVGESGSGKSTVKHLILRSYDPQEGRVLVDGIDLRTLDLRHYLEQVGVVDQEIMLFDRTLRENIIWARDNALPSLTDEQLLGICQQSCINRFFDRLTDGLDTMIGERGVRLSGGERQRVGIARALAREPSVLIFDEATSQLDAINEADITTSLENVSMGRTTVVIAHRLSTILSADEVIVMHRGQMVAMGTHQELYVACPQYQDLVGRQTQALERLYAGLGTSIAKGSLLRVVR